MKNNSSRNNSNGNSSRRGPRREQKKNMDYEARVTRNGVSANHLLNFSLPEREKSVHSHYKKKKKQSSVPRTQMEYLHANYRFVIAPLDPDAVVSMWDLEALAEWSSVEQVLLWYDVESPQTCPICMDTFRAPKITKCGHIFCWPCILRYLSMTEKYWRRCPMCFESVQKAQLRSVLLHQLQIPPHMGSDATFQLLERSKSSMFPHPRVLLFTGARGKTDSLLPSGVAESPERKRCRKLPSVNDADATYSRILEATLDYLQEMLYSEMRDLQSMDAEFRSSGDVENLPFVEEALRYTSDRLANSDDARKDGTYRSINVPYAKGESEESENGDAYSFYQIANGTYVILHPLNVKCLLKEFSDQEQQQQQGESINDAHKTDLEAVWTQEVASSETVRPNRYHLLPERISGRVLDIEHMVMNDEALKRYRFLSHLPRFCDFYICELDLTSQLSPSTLNAFQNELIKRSKQRKQKMKLQSATTPLCPIAKRDVSAFSLEQEGTMWPSPYEQALIESMEDVALEEYSSDIAEQESQSYASVVVEEQQSFERVTESSGSFPALGGVSTSDARPFGSNTIAFGSPSAWNSASSSPPAVAWTPGKKKKGAGKKGVSLFSTTQRRSYR